MDGFRGNGNVHSLGDSNMSSVGVGNIASNGAASDVGGNGGGDNAVRTAA